MNNNLDILKQMIKPIVKTCLELHEGGENYFNELDGMIKKNEEFIISYFLYALEREETNKIIASGEIGMLLLDLQLQNKISSDIDLCVINGGLRKNSDIYLQIKKYVLYRNENIIFFDDSYYSGKTANVVSNFVESECHGKIKRNYVFYDGSIEENDKVFSLYRYY